MNIKRAKQEIIDTISAYLEKDAYGQYRIPEIRQDADHGAECT